MKISNDGELKGSTQIQLESRKPSSQLEKKAALHDSIPKPSIREPVKHNSKKVPSSFMEMVFTFSLSK